MHLAEETRKETVIEKSRFIACAARIASEAQAREYIARIRREYPDATHVCTAWQLSAPIEAQRSSDDREPAGTAGRPMLEALLASSVTDACVCVVRYFGGIKLGAGGLIRAYAGAVTGCLATAAKLRDVTFLSWRLEYPYSLSGKLETWLRTHTAEPQFTYGEQAACEFLTETDITQTVLDLTRGEAAPVLLGQTVREVPADGTEPK